MAENKNRRAAQLTACRRTTAIYLHLGERGMARDASSPLEKHSTRKNGGMPGGATSGRHTSGAVPHRLPPGDSLSARRGETAAPRSQKQREGGSRHDSGACAKAASSQT